MGKDKARGKSSFSQAQKRKENLAQDAETEKHKGSLLTECKFDLTSIFVHWEPVFPLSEPQPSQPKDKPDPRRLACDTVHLLTKWSLRCLVEVSYDENRTKEFLCWLERAVIKHGEILDVLLDPGTKADLLRLHHQAFESHAGGSGRTEAFQQFTNIMIRLLEIGGHLPELHQTIVSACLSDRCRSGKSLATNFPPTYY